MRDTRSARLHISLFLHRASLHRGSVSLSCRVRRCCEGQILQIVAFELAQWSLLDKLLDEISARAGDASSVALSRVKTHCDIQIFFT